VRTPELNGDKTTRQQGLTGLAFRLFQLWGYHHGAAVLRPGRQHRPLRASSFAEQQQRCSVGDFGVLKGPLVAFAP
jgi:hypothetical protein